MTCAKQESNKSLLQKIKTKQGYDKKTYPK